MSTPGRSQADCYNADGLHKRGYATKSAAKDAIRNAMSYGGDRLTAYRGVCGRWHLGHKDPTPPLTFRAHPDDQARLEVYLHDTGFGLADVLRQALAMYLDEVEAHSA